MSGADVEITITLNEGAAKKLQLLAQQRGAQPSQMVREWIERELAEWVVDFRVRDCTEAEPIRTEPRSLEAALTDLTEKYYRLPDRDTQRPELARMIGQLKAEMEQRVSRATETGK